MGPKLIIHNTLDFPQNKQHKVHILAHICVPASSRVYVCILGLGLLVWMCARSASVGLEQIFPLCSQNVDICGAINGLPLYTRLNGTLSVSLIFLMLFLVR